MFCSCLHVVHMGSHW